jgi:hypothetical protein
METVQPRIEHHWDRSRSMKVDRQTVDLSAYPELVVIYLGMRQYWRDFEALERWARSEPHRLWWKQFLRDSGGTGFWHETYFKCTRPGLL